MFHFLRQLPRPQGFGGPIVFECPAESRDCLAPLLQDCEVAPLRGREQPQARFDLSLPLMTLPHRLGLIPLKRSRSKGLCSACSRPRPIIRKQRSCSVKRYPRPWTS
jgi:hypothetical protein